MGFKPVANGNTNAIPPPPKKNLPIFVIILKNRSKIHANITKTGVSLNNKASQRSFSQCFDSQQFAFWKYRHCFITIKLKEAAIPALKQLQCVRESCTYEPNFKTRRLSEIYELFFLQILSSFAEDNFTTVDPELLERQSRHKDLVQETVEIGMMFASKAFVQLLANPFVGPLTHKYAIISINEICLIYHYLSVLMISKLFVTKFVD